MGVRGPKPTPSNLRLLRGERQLNKDEPPAPADVPQLPKDTNPAVREVWDYTLTQLDAMGLTSSADRDALLAYCEAVVAHRMAADAVHEHGALVVGSTGSLIKNPALSALNEAAGQISKFASHFGLTPSSRSSIKVGKAKGGGSDGKSADRYLTG